MNLTTPLPQQTGSAGAAQGPPAPRPAQAPAALASFRPGTRVVVADDDDASQRLLTLLLQKFGLEVHAAFDGLRAIELVRQVTPALVLMDMYMPVMDGVDAIRALRGDSGAPQPPVVVLSANVFGGREAQDLNALGVVEILTKPVNRAQLHAVLARLLPTA